MAENTVSEISSAPSSIRQIVSGQVTIKEVLVHHSYCIPDYPVYEVELIRVKLEEKADADISVFDAFIRAFSKPTQLHIPCDV